MFYENNFVVKKDDITKIIQLVNGESKVEYKKFGKVTGLLSSVEKVSYYEVAFNDGVKEIISENDLVLVVGEEVI